MPLAQLSSGFIRPQWLWYTGYPIPCFLLAKKNHRVQNHIDFSVSENWPQISALSWIACQTWTKYFFALSQSPTWWSMVGFKQSTDYKAPSAEQMATMILIIVCLHISFDKVIKGWLLPNFKTALHQLRNHILYLCKRLKRNNWWTHWPEFFVGFSCESRKRKMILCLRQR